LIIETIGGNGSMIYLGLQCFWGNTDLIESLKWLAQDWVKEILCTN